MPKLHLAFVNCSCSTLVELLPDVWSGSLRRLDCLVLEFLSQYRYTEARKYFVASDSSLF